MGKLAAKFATVPATLLPDQRAVELGMAYLHFARTNPQDIDIITLHGSVHADPPSPEHLLVEDTVVGVFREGAAQGHFSLAGETRPKSPPSELGPWCKALPNSSSGRGRSSPREQARIIARSRRPT